MRQQIMLVAAAILVSVSFASLAFAQFNLIPNGAEENGVPDLHYDPATGNVTLSADGGTNIGLFQLLSTSGIFTGAPAMLPADGLFGVDTDGEIAKAAFSAVSELNLGNVAQTGLSSDFLVQDLTAALVSGGFGFPNLTLELVGTFGDHFPPEAMDAALTIRLGQTAEHMFQALDQAGPAQPDLVWSNLQLGAGSPAVAATLGADGSFSWDSSGSPLGLYTWTATVSDPMFADFDDTATLEITVVIPEPASASLLILALSCCGLVRRRRDK